MAQCRTCGDYYRRSQHNHTNECDTCVDQIIQPFTDFDDEDLLEVENIMNPAGKIQPKFYE